jgi:phosphoglycolate phosphatase-like HAD superfamily hydrolase
MNLLGKIFVVLILIMSLMFMTMALMVFATHKNWKEEITRTEPPGWKARYEQLVQQNQKLQADHQALQKEVVAERTAKAEALAKMQTELSERQQELTTAKTQLTQQGQQLIDAVATLKTQEENVNAATAQVQKLTEDLKAQVAMADQLFQKSLVLANELNQANVKLPELTERNEQLAQMLANARLLLSQVGMTLEDPIDLRPPPLEAHVENVNARGEVEIAAGSHDGIRVGHVLDVVSGRSFLGKIRITNVTRDRAIGRIMPPAQRISRGDTATSKLSPVSTRVE